MEKYEKRDKFPSELRLDLVSNDWVIIATGRARRPETFADEERIKEEVSQKDCPFCQEKILKKSVETVSQPGGDWFVLSIPNDFPALSKGDSLNRMKEGPNRKMDGVGYHEVIITKDHDRQIALFSAEEIKLVIDLYQKRYLDLINREFIEYISIFHNHGKEAGASIVHPHSQLIAIPVVDPDLRVSLDGAESYFRKNKRCVYCDMIEWDLKDGRRIIYQNDEFVVLSPFAPQASFEVRVYPKDHQPHFEKMNEKSKLLFADATREALFRVYDKLKDPSYNFYFHTAPNNEIEHDQYHWHLNILPKTSIMAGFELSVGIEISTIEPEEAARFLRGD